MMDLGYFLYMSEAEGITANTSTRQTRLNAAINDFVAAARCGKDIDDPDLQAVILEDYNLEDLTSTEADYIATKVKKAIYKGR